MSLRLTILKYNKFEAVGFIRCERFYSEEHINASGVTRRASCIFSIGDGSARVCWKDGGELRRL